MKDMSFMSDIHMSINPVDYNEGSLSNLKVRKVEKDSEVILQFKLFDKEKNEILFNKIREVFPTSRIALVDPDGMFGIEFPICCVITDMMEIETIDDNLKILDKGVR